MSNNRTDYMRKWREKNPDYSKKRANYFKKWKVDHSEQVKQISKKNHVERCFGGVKRYNEALMKYESECAFDSEHKAQLVHHLDGKSVYNSSKKEVNNNLNNLLPLCIGCHVWLHKRKIGGKQ